MTPQKRDDMNKGFAIVHQWMTVIGFPVLLYLVGDMYSDFKRVIENDIRQDQKIESIQKTNDRQDEAINTLSQYVFRGIK